MFKSKLILSFLALFCAFGLSAQRADQAKEYIKQQKSELGITDSDVSGMYMSNSTKGSDGSFEVLYMQQAKDGISIHNSIMNVIIGRDGNIVGHRGTLATHIDRRATSSTPSISPESALQSAVNHLQLGSTVNVKVLEPGIGANQEGILSKSGVSTDDILFKLVYQDAGSQGLILCWELVIHELSSQHWWQIRIDASNGAFVDKNDWVANCGFDHSIEAALEKNHSLSNDCTGSAAAPSIMGMPSAPVPNGYNVYGMPIESPSHGARANEIEPWLDGSGSPFGWHDDNGAAGAEYTITRGNNVLASEDQNNDNVPGFSPDGGATLDFDFPINFANAPTDYEEAAITNLFYWNNICHDVLYEYGFDEASGNFQENNYGNGGLGSDYVNADALDGSGTNNANFGTPPDGSNPRMQMYVWTFTTPAVTSDLDNGIIVHEYGHGVSNRLTGGGDNTGCLSNTEQMGEGWSDYLGLIMTIEPGDAGDDSRGIGTYALGQPTTGAGIRQYPYTTDMSVNLHTYGDVGSVAVPHGVGSIWCEMLWEMTWSLIDVYGFDPDIYNGTGGNNIALQLVMDGMKLQPCSPGFVDGRDAILEADQINNGGANQCLIWEAFAKRGLGFFADQGSSGSVTDGTEDFNIPCFCTETPGPLGCTDPTACNYDPTAGCEDLSCIASGCTDAAACNYNPDAGCDDGSCNYAPITATFNLTTDCWGGEVSWELQDDAGNIIQENAISYGNQTTYEEILDCLAPGACYTFVMKDSFGDGLAGIASGCSTDGTYNCEDSEGNILFDIGPDPNYGSQQIHEFCMPGSIDGCTDPTACNYDATATADDGSCILPDGCTDMTACNYDATATCDDGSCILPDGCTDMGACNYDASAQCDDGSCEFTSCLGCTDPTACNFDPSATIEDGTCILPDGCTDMSACNYDASANCDDGSCILPDGCTDAAACNYDVTAVCDDGSCILPDGCTDMTACNYDASAQCDDGSCILPDGCTDMSACNYDASATCDDGSCILPDGCTDMTACNYDASAQCEDGSCTYPDMTYYLDADSDGYGDMAESIVVCDPVAPLGYSADNTDCDDDNDAMYPGAPGTMEGIDNDCNGTVEGDEVLPCIGDMNDDGFRNVADLLILLGDFGCSGACTADLNGDGLVNAADALIFLAVFGIDCP